MTRLERTRAAIHLRAAAMLIDDPARWTQRVLARDENGTYVPPESDRARCWCALGALEYFGAPGFIDNEARDWLGDGIGCLNDRPDTTNADMVNALLLVAELIADER